jgi:transposase, IS30 family
MPTKCYTHLSAEDRETLSLGLAHGHSPRMMASVLRRSPSTVSRESARNTARGRPYRACTAQTQAATRPHRPRRPRKLLDPWLWQYVRTHLAEGCSPEQIAGRLRRAYPDDLRAHLSAETIYVGLSVWPRGVLRSELLAALRQARKARRPRARGTDRRGQIPTMTPMAERPAEVTTRTVPARGGRLDQGHPQWVGRWHAGRADDTPGHPDQDGRDRCHECPSGLHEKTPVPPRPAAQNPDV